MKLLANGSREAMGKVWFESQASSVVVYHPQQRGASDPSGWLHKAGYARILHFGEVPDGQTAWKVDRFKELTGGGEVTTGRMLYKNEAPVAPRAMPVIGVNNYPSFSVTDQAMENRQFPVSMSASFFDPEEYESERKRATKPQLLLNEQNSKLPGFFTPIGVAGAPPICWIFRKKIGPSVFESSQPARDELFRFVLDGCRRLHRAHDGMLPQSVLPIAWQKITADRRESSDLHAMYAEEQVTITGNNARPGMGRDNANGAEEPVSLSTMEEDFLKWAKLRDRAQAQSLKRGRANCMALRRAIEARAMELGRAVPHFSDSRTTTFRGKMYNRPVYGIRLSLSSSSSSSSSSLPSSSVEFQDYHPVPFDLTEFANPSEWGM